MGGDISFFRLLKGYYLLRKYEVGRKFERFVDKDVKREIVVVSNDRLSDGIITVRIKQYNLLYLSKGITNSKPEFSMPKEIELKSLWTK